MKDIIKNFQETILAKDGKHFIIRTKQFAAKYQKLTLEEYNELIEEILRFISNDTYCKNDKIKYLNAFYSIGGEEAKLEILNNLSDYIAGESISD